MAYQEKECTHFLHFIKWDEHLANMHLLEAKCALILQLKAPTSAKESVLCTRLGKVIDDDLNWGMVVRWNHNNPLRVHKHLTQGAILSSNVYVIHRRHISYYSDCWTPLSQQPLQ
jgi:hypothetical protein